MPEYQVVTPLTDMIACVGEDVTFTVEFDDTGGSIIWEAYDPDTGRWDTIDTFNNNTYTFFNVQPEDDGKQIRCYAGNACHTEFSGPVTLTVSSPFSLASQPSDVAAAVGDTAEFTLIIDPPVEAQYTWEVNRGAGFTIVPGVNQPVLTLTQVFPSDAGLYRCTVWNGCICETSQEAILTVIPNESCECSANDLVSQPRPVPASARLSRVTQRITIGPASSSRG